MHWLDTRMEQVQIALAQHTPLAALPPKPKPTGSDDGNDPADPAWLAAKASGILSFMPEDEIRNYTEISKWQNHRQSTRPQSAQPIMAKNMLLYIKQPIHI